MAVFATLKTYASGGVFVGFGSYPSDGLFGGLAPGLNKIHPLCLIVIRSHPFGAIAMQNQPAGAITVDLRPLARGRINEYP